MLKNQLCVTGINYILKYIQIEKLVYIVIIFLNITVFTIIFSNLISQVTKQAVFSCLSRNVWERWRRKKDWRKYMMLSSNFLLLTTGNPNTHYTWITSSTICHWKCDRESSDIFVFLSALWSISSNTWPIWPPAGERRTCTLRIWPLSGPPTCSGNPYQGVLTT